MFGIIQISKTGEYALGTDKLPLQRLSMVQFEHRLALFKGYTEKRIDLKWKKNWIFLNLRPFTVKK